MRLGQDRGLAAGTMTHVLGVVLPKCQKGRLGSNSLAWRLSVPVVIIVLVVELPLP